MRPGWWTVSEAEKVIKDGLSSRMMLEMSPDKSFGVLSPAFKGSEKNFALKIYSENGCTFLKDNLCELHGTKNQPLECRVSHHNQKGIGKSCHMDIGREWNSEEGKALIVEWSKLTCFLSKIKALSI